MTTQILALFHPRSARTPLGFIGHAMDLHRQRRRLAALDDHLLQDIGITRQQALQEARQPVWNAPAHWMS